MQQFTVPQFIDVEDKIIGPITTRQFLILLAETIVAAISYSLFDFSLFITIFVTSLFTAFVFAFVKVNGRPFHLFVLNICQTLSRAPLRVWLLVALPDSMILPDEIKKSENIPTKKVNLQASRLDQLSLIVDTSGQYRGEDLIKKEIKPNNNVRK
ncbi:MAG: PrgI family protein [bacterium]